MTYQKPYKGKQTVCRHDRNALAFTKKGMTHYVSTYNGESWRQTDCEWSEIDRVKAEHLADTKFLNRAGPWTKAEAYKAGLYRMSAPPVCTARWNQSDWIKFIGNGWTVEVQS